MHSISRSAAAASIPCAGDREPMIPLMAWMLPLIASMPLGALPLRRDCDDWDCGRATLRIVPPSPLPLLLAPLVPLAADLRDAGLPPPLLWLVLMLEARAGLATAVRTCRRALPLLPPPPPLPPLPYIVLTLDGGVVTIA